MSAGHLRYNLLKRRNVEEEKSQRTSRFGSHL